MVTGCGPNRPKVSGKVTANGSPVAGVQVLFIPVSTKDVPFPGPCSQGVTDVNGVYSLVTDKGDKGSTEGLNVVEFYPKDAFEVEFMESDAARLMAEAQNDSSHPSFKKAKEIIKKAKSLKSIATGQKLKAGATTEFAVPPDGTDAADFELTELAETTNN